MFAVIYAFTVKPGCQAVFEEAWAELTVLIREYEGGLGSRLHRKTDEIYIAYAQWPDRATWENSGDNLPESAQPIRLRMRESCEKMETLHELDGVKDLLVPMA